MPRQIVAFDEARRLRFDADAWEAVLRDLQRDTHRTEARGRARAQDETEEIEYDARDEKIGCLAVCGPLRSGKSTLLTRIVEASKLSRGTESVEEFPSRWGRNFCTEGIWAKALPKTADSPALLLLDTQGLFDGVSSQRQTVALFALAVFASSYLIYNVEKRVQEDQLQHLALFSEFAKAVGAAAASSSSSEKPFQHLDILVRDYEYLSPDGEDVREEEEAHFRDLFRTRANNLDAIQIRDAILSAFESVDVRLLPHPGMDFIDKAKHSNTGGEALEAGSPLFKRLLGEYCEGLRGKVTPKTIFGVKLVAARELGELLKDLVDRFNAHLEDEDDEDQDEHQGSHEDRLPPSVSLLEAHCRVSNEEARRRAMREFEARFIPELASGGTPNRDRETAIRRLYNSALEAAESTFRHLANFGPEPFKRKYAERLNREAHEQLVRYLAALGVREARARRMKVVAAVAVGGLVATPVIAPAAAASALGMVATAVRLTTGALVTNLPKLVPAPGNAITSMWSSFSTLISSSTIRVGTAAVTGGGEGGATGGDALLVVSSTGAMLAIAFFTSTVVWYAATHFFPPDASEKEETRRRRRLGQTKEE